MNAGVGRPARVARSNDFVGNADGGPRYVKVGNRVLYRLEDIEDYENANTHTSTQPVQQPILAGGAAC